MRNRLKSFIGLLLENGSYKRRFSSCVASLMAVFFAMLFISGLSVPASAQNLTVNTQNRQESWDFYVNSYWPPEETEINWTGNHDTCVPGTTSKEFQDGVLLRVNYFRLMAGMQSVYFSDYSNRLAQAAALIMSANGKLSHTPPTDWLCYSPEGAQGAGSSNLAGGLTGWDAITLYMNEGGAAGHRRWVINPDGKEYGTGDVPSSAKGWATNALRVFGAGWATRPATREEFTAWPPPGYVPYPVVFSNWSFALRNANFSSASVTMSKGGVNLPVTLQPIVNGYGDNAIIWRSNSIKDGDPWPKPANDETYHIKVQNVMDSGQNRTFEYDVTVFDPTLDPTRNILVVTNTKDKGKGSLRSAVQRANHVPSATIRFNIPQTDAGYANGHYTIKLASALPDVFRNRTIIDAMTQPDYAGTPLIELSGASAGNATGLTFTGGNCVVKGLVINGFSVHGIQFLHAPSSGGTVQGCYIGTDATGTKAVPNGDIGLFIADGSGNHQIGGTTGAEGNVISGNAGIGLAIHSTGGNNTIRGNSIGTNRAGTAALGNGAHGIDIAFGSNNNIVGGTAVAEGNVISGNKAIGLKFFQSSSNTIQGNSIGTAMGGNAPIANGSTGLHLDNGSSNNIVGGTDPSSRNVISGNKGSGVGIANNCNENIFLNNYIGVGANGTKALGNGVHGIDISSSASNKVGEANVGNVIASNGALGIYIRDASSIGNKVLGNKIGTNALGTAALGNASDGIKVDFGPQATVIGGAAAGEGNLIAGNIGNGIAIFNAATTGTLVRGNHIGTDSAGDNPLPNAGQGIIVGYDSAHNTIGGPTAGEGNRIAFNREDGVRVFSTASKGNAVRGNAIWGNSKLGINLDGGIQDNFGATSNDIGDADDGPNALQNFPDITNVSVTGGQTTISGTLNSSANTAFIIDCFGSASGDTSGFGEGQTYLGSVNTTTDATGKGSFSLNVLGTLVGQFVTATATNTATGDTSEFSYLGLSQIVTQTGDSGYGSLRNAINFANNAPGTTIRFAIPTSDPYYVNGVFSIQPTSALPTLIADGTVIDGTSQPGFAGTPLIELNGVGAPAGTNGLLIQAAKCTVKSLIVNHFNDGIQFRNATAANNLVQGCYIGTDAGGTKAAPNTASGVAFLAGAHDITIGGTTAAARNVISGNVNGIWIADSGSANIVSGNYIGTDKTGQLAVPNTDRGVMILGGAHDNTIGGTAVGARNVIAGNRWVGVGMADPGTSGNKVLGNYIGLDVNAAAALGNGGDGVSIWNQATNNVIGGSTVAARNVISGNGSSGIGIGNLGTKTNLVQGNYVGTDQTGTVAVPNAHEGIILYGGTQQNTIGGMATGTGNLISGNTLRGIFIGDSSTNSNLVRGNLIGTDVSGTAKLGNGYEGILLIGGASKNTIGGSTATARNVISGNQRSGFYIVGVGTNSNLIQGNSIGTDAGGTLKLGNNGDGLILLGGAGKTVIGGTATGEENRIAFNNSNGVNVVDSATQGTAIRGNAIYSNGRLAIDLAGGTQDNAGVTTNDSKDADSGPNNLQNYPILTAVNSVSGTTTIAGTLNSTPNRTFALDFYHSSVADGSGYGEGEGYLTVPNSTVTTDANGNVSFSFSVSGSYGGQYCTATATDSTTGDTSEFSAARLVLAPPPNLTINDVAQAEGQNGTSNMVFTVTLAAPSSQTVTVQYATADGTATAGSDYTAKNGTLTIPKGQTTGVINVPILGDTVFEANETFLVNLSNVRGAIVVDNQGQGTIENDDVPPLPTLTINDVTVTEGNAGTTNATFTVSLSAASNSSVTADYSTANGTVNPATAGSDYTAKSGTLSFAAGETTKTVTVVVVGDTLVEPDETFFVNLSNPVGGTFVGGDSQGLGTIVNDDSQFQFSSATYSAAENSGSATITVSRTGLATGVATVSYATANGTATAGSDYTSTNGTLNFGAGETSKSFSIPILNDSLIEVNETVNLALSNATGGALLGSPSTATLTLVDDDVAPSLSINDVSVTEGNTGTSNATFTVSLSAASSKTITVNYSTANGTLNPATAGSDYTAKSGTLTIAPRATSATITVQVTGDARHETNETFVVNLSDPVNATLANNSGVGTILDDDPIGFNITPSSGLVTTEAGDTASFTVKLSSQPTADVTLGLSSSNPQEGTVAPTSLTFTSTNWNLSQVVTVTGVDDEVQDGSVSYSILTGAPVSDDRDYSALSAAAVPDVSVTNMDNDTAGVTVSPTTGLTTTEAGGKATFSVKLNIQPTANVAISLSSTKTSEGTVSPSSVLFTPQSWSTAQVVTVTGVDDSIADGDQNYTILTAPAVSSDANYNGLDAADVLVSNTDNDVAGVVVSPTSGLITSESGSTATFTVRLSSQPLANVSIALSSSNTSEGTVRPASLLFTPQDWSTAHLVTVTGVDDDIADGPQAYTILTAPAVSGDANYSGADASDVSVSNTDNDTRKLLLALSGHQVAEGQSLTGTVTRNTPSTLPLTVSLASSDIKVATVQAQVTIATGQRSVGFSIQGVPDAVADGTQPATITASATTFTPASALVEVTDDDSVGIVVSPTQSLLTTEAGGTAVFSVVLSSQPTAPVRIGLSSSDASEGTVSPSELIFKVDNWNQAQTVTVTGVDDEFADGDQTYTVLTAPAVSGDANYNGLNADDIDVVNRDNQVPALNLELEAQPLLEGRSIVATLKRNTLATPALDVALFSSDISEATVPATVTFAAGEQSVTFRISGTEDEVTDGTQNATIRAEAVGLAAASIAITVYDVAVEVAPAVTAGDDVYNFILGPPGQKQQAGVTLLSSGIFQMAAPGVLANDGFVKGATLTVRPTSNPKNGRFQLRNDGSLFYLPSTGTIGIDEFTYSVSDGQTTATAKIRLNVIDKREPELRLDTPRDRATVATVPKVVGRVRDRNVGLKSVTLLWQRFDGKFWNGNAWSSSATELPLVVQGINWNYTGKIPVLGTLVTTSLLAGRYDLRVTATDKSGNHSSVTNRITVASTAPVAGRDTASLSVEGDELAPSPLVRSPIVLSAFGVRGDNQTILLAFNGALDGEAAREDIRYKVEKNGNVVEIEDIALSE